MGDLARDRLGVPKKRRGLHDLSRLAGTSQTVRDAAPAFHGVQPGFTSALPTQAAVFELPAAAAGTGIVASQFGRAGGVGLGHHRLVLGLDT